MDFSFFVQVEPLFGESVMRRCLHGAVPCWSCLCRLLPGAGLVVPELIFCVAWNTFPVDSSEKSMVCCFVAAPHHLCLKSFL